MKVRRNILEQLETRVFLSASLSSVAGSSIAYDSSGKLNIAYYDTSTHALKFATEAKGSSTLSTPTTIASFTATDLTGNLAVAVDPSGNAGVAYYDPSSGALKYAHFNGSAWDASTVDANVSSTLKPSIAFDSKGHALITYFQGKSGSLQYAQQSGNHFLKQTIAHSSDIVSSAVGVNPTNGKKIVAYQNKFGEIRYTEVSLVTQTQQSNSVFAFGLPGMFLLTPTVATTTSTTTTVEFASRQTVDQVSTVGTSLSMAFDSSGNPIFSYYDPHTGVIKLATKNGSTFSTQTVATVTAGSNPNPRVVLSNGKPTVIYYNAASNGLFSATLNGSTFASTQLAVGGQNALVAQSANGFAYTLFDSTLSTLSINQSSTTPILASNFAAAAASSASVNLTWTDNSSNETGFRIDRSTNGSTFTTLTTLAANTTSYTDTTAHEATTYYYRLYAIGSDGSAILATIKPGAGSSNTALATTYPAGASTLTATETTSTITLHWADNSAGESGYKVERSTDGGATYTLLSTVNSNTTQFVDSNLTEGTSYSYRVTAFNSTGNAIALTGSFTTQPAAPTNLAATVQSPTLVDLLWTDNSSHETGYIVERSTDGGTTFTQVASLAAGSTSYADVSAPDNTALIYRVKAVVNGTSSAYATSPVATTPQLSPPAPINLTPTVASSGEIDLAWTGSAGDSSFLVERSTDGTNYTALATLGATTLTFSDTTVIDGTTYDYKIVATNSGGSSSSTAASATTPIAAATNLAASVVGAGDINLTWHDNSSSATAYFVQRSADGTDYIQIAALGANATSYEDNTLADAKTAYYRVVASNSGGSATSSTISTITPLAAPADLTATATGAGTITLSWADNSASETNYQIYRADDGGSFALIDTIAADSQGYTDTTVASGHSYQYQVRAITASTQSDFSNSSDVIVVS